MYTAKLNRNKINFTNVYNIFAQRNRTQREIIPGYKTKTYNGNNKNFDTSYC